MTEIKVAALYVQRGGAYFGIPGVDPWDESRDARLYPGPYPVVAHPPCARWCRLAGLVEKRWGHKKGDDGGCFASALDSVRRWGGVLEHPAYSDAWKEFALPVPDRDGGWRQDVFGGSSCHVEQAWYGHGARKATWLYAVGVNLPELKWGPAPSELITHQVSHLHWDNERTPLSKSEAKATPKQFRDILIDMAMSSRSAASENE